MPKVQKPQPKSLNKTKQIEGVSKEKLKVNKSKKLADKAGVVEAVAEIKKKNAPTKPEKKKITSIAKPTPKSKPSKKPLVLAPPESPVVLASKDKRSGSKQPKTAGSIPAPVLKSAKSSFDAEPAPKLGKKKSHTPSTKIVSEGIPTGKAKKTAGSREASSAKAAKGAVIPSAPKTVGAPKGTKRPHPELVPTVEKVAKKSKENIAKSTQPEGTGKKQKKQSNVEKSVKVKPESKEKLGKKNKSGKNEVTGVNLNSLHPGSKKVIKKETNVAAKKGLKTAPTQAKSKIKKEATQKPKTQNLELDFELKPFDEDKFYEILSLPSVQKVCDAVKAQAAEELKQKKSLSLFSDYKYILQVCCYKIPSAPKRMVKLHLKNSLFGSNDDGAIIVTDLQRGARFDYEPTVQHYEDLLREAGVEQRLTVVPFNRLRNDVGSFEAKRKFLNSFDYLLCDGRISGQTTAFFGTATQRPRNVLHAVHMNKKENIAKEISRALKRTAYRQLRKGDLTSIPVGNHEHSSEELSENILTVIKQLEQHYPGGLANIRSIYLKIGIVGTSALPLYISMCSPPADTPYVVGPREQRMLKLKKQANEVLTRFALTKDVEFVKLTPGQVKRKAELKEKRNALKAEDAKDAVDGNDDVKKIGKNAVKNEDESDVEDDEEENLEEDNDDDEDEDEDGNEDEDGDEDEDDDEDDDDEDDDEDEED